MKTRFMKFVTVMAMLVSFFGFARAEGELVITAAIENAGEGVTLSGPDENGTYSAEKVVLSADTKLTLTCAGADIYYTTDATDPEKPTTPEAKEGTSKLYNGPIVITEDMVDPYIAGLITIKAIAYKKAEAGSKATAEVSDILTIDLRLKVKPAAPTFSPEGGAVEANSKVMIINTAFGSSLWLSEDGGEFAQITGFMPSYTVVKPVTVRAYVEMGGEHSDTTMAVYTIKVPAPTFDHDAGEVAAGTKVAVVMPEGVDSMMVATAATLEQATQFVKYMKNDTLVISKDTAVRAYAMKDNKSSDTVPAEYTVPDPNQFTFVPKVMDGENEIVLTKLPANEYTPYDFYKAEDVKKDLTVAFECNKPGATIKYVARDITAYGESKEITETYSGPISVKDLFQSGELNITAAVKFEEVEDTIQVRLLAAAEPEEMHIMAGLYYNGKAMTQWTKNGNPSQADMGEYVDASEIKGGDATGVYAYNEIRNGSVLKMDLLYSGFMKSIRYTLDGTEANDESQSYGNLMSSTGWELPGITLNFPEGKDSLKVNVFAKDLLDENVTTTASFTFTKNLRPDAPTFVQKNGNKVDTILVIKGEADSLFVATGRDSLAAVAAGYKFFPNNDTILVSANTVVLAYTKTGKYASDVVSLLCIKKLDIKPTFHMYVGQDQDYNWLFEPLELTRNGNNYTGFFKFDPNWGKVAWLMLECDPFVLGATIYYTKDGTTPTEQSIKYADAKDPYYCDGKGISITDFYFGDGETYVNPVEVKAIVVKDGMSSDVITFTLKEGSGPVGPAVVPVFNVAVNSPTQVFEFTKNGNSATAMEPGDGSGIYIVEDVPEMAARVVVYDEKYVASKAYYTTDGSEPTKASKVFDLTDVMGKIDIVFAEGSDEFVLRMLAFNDNRPQDSAFMKLTCKKDGAGVPDRPEAPEFDPEGGAVEEYTEITLTSATEGAWIYYVFADEKDAEGVEYEQYYEENKPMVTSKDLKLWAFSRITFEGIHFYSDTVMAEYTIKDVAIEGKELAGVSVYPNPNNGEFYVAVPVAAQVEVFAVNGQKVASMNVVAGKNVVRLDNAGIYFVRVRANGQDAIRKVVVR